jgi:hypoxanthine-DNA glycosylase
MPGEASLRAAQYYAHPRNLFWRILGEIVGAGPDLGYEERLHALTAAGIALWDVLQSCRRPGSLDADIVGSTVVRNDFATFFRAHPRIRRVVFNGATAERLYRRLVLPGLAEAPLAYTRLPSTSPAHAALTYDRKLAAWRAAFREAGRPPARPASRTGRR